MQLRVIQQKIYLMRGLQVMLDYDLASLYGVSTKVLNQAVKRNLNRFPADFMFRLTEEEYGKLFVRDEDSRRSQFVTAYPHQKFRNVNAKPFAFTEQGVAMLSSVLRSDRAIEVNIEIMRVFVFIRQYALSHKDLTEKLREMEANFNRKFSDVYEAIDYLLKKDKQEKQQQERRPLGYRT